MFTWLGASAAQAQTIVSHEADFAFDGANAQADIYDTFSSPKAVTFASSAPIYGDPTTFVWDGSGALSVSGVRTSANTGSATLAMTGTGSALAPLIGFSHYGYASTVGQGLFNVTNIGANLRLSLAVAPASFAVPNTSTVLNMVFLGNWSTNGTGPLQIDAASFGVPSGFTVTKNFVYDSTFDETFFSAAAAPVPEPGETALLFSMTATAGLIALRRRQAEKPTSRR